MRYYECSRLIQLWRCHHLLIVPFHAAGLWLQWHWFLWVSGEPKKEDWAPPLWAWSSCWRLAHSLAHTRMRRYVTATEAFTAIRRRKVD